MGGGGLGGQPALPGGAAPSWGRWGRGGGAERAAMAVSPAVPSGETELGVGGGGAGGITPTFGGCSIGVPGLLPAAHTHTCTHTHAHACTHVQPQLCHSSCSCTPPQRTWKKPGGMGPPAMPSLGGRFPITGLGAAAALCGERRAQHCAPHPGQHPPHPTELPRAHLRPWGGAAGALPLCPPSTLGGPSHLHRPHSRPTSPTAGGAVGSACEREGSAGRVGAMPTRGPQRGCGGGGGCGGLQGGPAPLCCQPRSGGSC